MTIDGGRRNHKTDIERRRSSPHTALSQILASGHAYDEAHLSRFNEGLLKDIPAAVWKLGRRLKDVIRIFAASRTQMVDGRHGSVVATICGAQPMFRIKDL